LGVVALRTHVISQVDIPRFDEHNRSVCGFKSHSTLKPNAKLHDRVGVELWRVPKSRSPKPGQTGLGVQGVGVDRWLAWAKRVGNPIRRYVAGSEMGFTVLRRPVVPIDHVCCVLCFDKRETKENH
jgi:hypothetical protein